MIVNVWSDLSQFVRSVLGSADAAAMRTAISAVGTGDPDAAATASKIALRDGNANLVANAFIPGGASTPTAAGTTTLTIADKQSQVFTGSTTQTVKLPTTGVKAGQVYVVSNQSSATVTVQSSGANLLVAVPTVKVGVFIAAIDAPTTAAHWSVLAPNASAASPNMLAQRDGNGCLFATSYLVFPSSVPTAAGTSVLSVANTSTVVFTGSTTQNVKLPTTSVQPGYLYTIANQSSGAVTVQASDGTTVDTVASNAVKLFIPWQTTPTTSTHWRSI